VTGGGQSDGARPALADLDQRTPVGSILAAELDGAAVAVIRHTDGWVAVPDACPHADCALTLDGEVSDGMVLACNCHGSEFDLRTGAVLLGPAERAPTVRPLQDRDGRLVPG
jgi:nitrite reductase/ring-hydroxylating ferredoxin subunit